MITEGYRFRFRDDVDLRQAEATLLLSLVAAGGIYGETRVRMDAAYAVDSALHVIAVDASTDVGQDVAGIFTAFITREFGPTAFSVRPLGQEVRS